MVVWFTTSFGWTEIVFAVFLEKILAECGIDTRPVRKCRHYIKGPKPTISAVNNGITGEELLQEIHDVILVELKHGNELPDLLIISDDTDCRVVRQAKGAYFFNSSGYERKVRQLTELVKNHSPGTRIVFMLAAPEIESWFLADCNMTFCREFKGFTLQSLHQQCKGVLPLANLERFSVNYRSNSCDAKLSEDCIQNYPGAERYSKREQGQIFLKLIRPSKVRSLKHFFVPAYDAIRNGVDFIP